MLLPKSTIPFLAIYDIFDLYI